MMLFLLVVLIVVTISIGVRVFEIPHPPPPSSRQDELLEPMATPSQRSQTAGARSCCMGRKTPFGVPEFISVVRFLHSTLQQILVFRGIELG